MQHIIKNFKLLSGKHCVTCALRQVFYYYDHKISEEMLFGLAEALNFLYFDFKGSPYPMIGGRNKIIEFEENLVKALNIKIEIKKTNRVSKAHQELQKSIVNNQPIMLYVDMGELSYLKLPQGVHFGGHAVVAFGLDEKKDKVYISDRDKSGAPPHKYSLSDKFKPGDFHLAPIAKLKIARNSKQKPYPPQNKWLEFDFAHMCDIDAKVIKRAIKNNMEFYLNPPIKNLGLKGIKLFANKILTDWKSFDTDKLKGVALNCFIFINEVGGTGGGIFRKMYGDFLLEAAAICKSRKIENAGIELKKIGKSWDEVGNKFYTIYEKGGVSLLDEIAKKLDTICEKETILFNELYQNVL